MSSWFDLDQVLPDIWRLDDGGLDTCYVLRGSERTGIIDTGQGVGSIAAQAARVGNAPPLVINTHVHPDHVSGNWEFEDVAIGAVEWRSAKEWLGTVSREPGAPGSGRDALKYLRTQRPFPPEFDADTYRTYRMGEPTRLLNEGDVVSLGGFDLEVIVAAAHTLGSVLLLDRKRRVLFSGDTALQRTMWLHLAMSAEPRVAVATYRRLAALADEVDYILPGHRTVVLPGSFLTELADNAEAVLQGRREGQPMSTFAGDGTHYDFGDYGLLFAKPVEEW